MRHRAALSWALSLATHALLVVLLLSAGIALLPRSTETVAGDGPSAFLWEAAPKEAAARVPQPANADATAPVLAARESAAAAAVAVQSAVDTAQRMDALGASQRDSLTATMPMMPRTLQSPGTVLAMAGIRIHAARRVAFLIDASGSMLGAFPSAVDAVLDAVARLSDEQQFAVIAFQAGEAFVPEGEPLRRAGATLGQRGRDQLRQWLLDRVIPGGGSDPRKAVRTAMAMRPDTVVLVSSGLLGAGNTVADRDALLADLNALNPRDARTGRRPAVFACVHLMQAEPLGALELVAREHGVSGSYRFIPRLAALNAPSDPLPAADDPLSRSLEAAVARAKAGDIPAARVALLRIGLAHPLHEASPPALLAAAEISLNHDKDTAAARRLASAAAEGARAFGLVGVQQRAEAISRDPQAAGAPPIQGTHP